MFTSMFTSDGSKAALGWVGGYCSITALFSLALLWFACGSKVLSYFLRCNFGAERQNYSTIAEKNRSAEG
jgi:hypothetical protein